MPKKPIKPIVSCDVQYVFSQILLLFKMRKNSVWSTTPLPVVSASRIISYSSSSVIVSPNSMATRFKFANEMFCVPSSTNKRNAFKISSFVSFSDILCVINCKKLSYDNLPTPCAPTDASIAWISSLVGSKPSARIATFRSLLSIRPTPSESNSSNASLMSAFWASDK